MCSHIAHSSETNVGARVLATTIHESCKRAVSMLAGEFVHSRWHKSASSEEKSLVQCAGVVHCAHVIHPICSIRIRITEEKQQNMPADDIRTQYTVLCRDQRVDLCLPKPEKILLWCSVAAGACWKCCRQQILSIEWVFLFVDNKYREKNSLTIELLLVENLFPDWICGYTLCVCVCAGEC